MWASKALWIAALRSPDVIAAVIALVLTVLTGVVVRLGTAASVAAMASSAIKPTAVSGPSQLRNPRSPSGLNQPTSAPVPPVTGRVAPESHIVSENDATKRRRSAAATGRTPAGIAPRRSPASTVGWLSIASTIDMDIFDGAKLLGNSRTPGITLAAGTHALELVNDATGFRTRRDVHIRAGHLEQIDIDLPTSTIHLNAVPWAEVWIDGTLVGQTPIGNHPITIGPHQILFRHPVFGGKEIATIVTADGPNRVTARLIQAAP